MDKFEFMRRIGDICDKLEADLRADLKAIGNRIPVGGAHMDNFFRSEAIAGLLAGLREGKTLTESIADGKEASTRAVLAWNKRREWQVHRTPDTAHSYLLRTVLSVRRKMKAGV